MKVGKTKEFKLDRLAKMQKIIQQEFFVKTKTFQFQCGKRDQTLRMEQIRRANTDRFRMLGGATSNNKVSIRHHF